jgi:glutathione S-transferase
MTLSNLIEDEVFRVYLLSGLILVFKMIITSFNVTRLRFKHKLFKYEEDYLGKKKKKDFETDPNYLVKKGEIDRAYGLHVNDMENIYLFFFVGLAYALTSPSVFLAKILFSVYVASRWVHMISYLFSLQPWRALTYFINILITVYMAGSSILSILNK